MASLGLIGMVGGIGGEMVKQADEERKMAGLKDFETWKLGVMNELKMQEESRAEARTIAGEQRGIANRSTERGLVHSETVQRAPELRDIKSADRKAEKMAEYDPEVTDARLSAEEAAARAKARVEREETALSGNDPAYTGALRKIALAKHIEGLGSVATAELAKYSLAEKQKVADLIAEFESPATAAERKAQIRESLTVRGIIKPNNEFDTQEVTTTTLNDDGSETKTRRLERRKVDGSAPTGGRKVGEASVVKAGPHKGKTVVWDGKGWKLKD